MRILLIIGFSLFANTVFAGVYKCTDANGKTDYQATPCSVGRENVELNIKTGSSVNLDDKQKQMELEQQLKEKEALIQKMQEKQQQEQLAELKQRAATETSKNQNLIKNNPQQFSAFAIPPYEYDNLPEQVKDYRDRLPEIEYFRRIAAQKALSTGECIRVEAVELNIKTTKTGLVFLVDCSSSKKFYFSEQELNTKS